MPRPKLAQAATMPQAQAGSRVGNGTALLPGIDGRTSGARRYRELYAGLIGEITRSRREPSHAEQILTRRAAMLIMECERAEAEAVVGKPVDLTAYTAATNALRRILIEAGVVETLMKG